MKVQLAPYLAVVVALGAAGWALIHKQEPVPEPAQVAPAAPETANDPANQAQLPPNHPAVPSMSAMPPGASPHDMMQGAPGAPAGGDPDPAITWTVPSGWQTAPNPNAMRIATYHPSATSPSLEVSVSRAGGSTDANIERWVHQFDGAAPTKRTDSAVHGLDVHVVEVTGTYLGGGMMTGTPSEPHTGWMLVGAVVDAQGSHYFFKMLGPAEQVRGARASFDAMLKGVAPH